LLRALGHALVEDDGARRAEAAVVLGGDENGERILKAAQLQRDGFVPLILVSGPPYLDRNESDYTIPFALRHGFPNGHFEGVPNRADSTRSESKILGTYLHNHGIATILLVTSNYHTKRAKRLMQIANPKLTIAVVPALDPNFDPNCWWQTRSGQKMFVNEVAKTIAMELGD
jgi:uncharacterized SAM-binding protein YcdF (DUF218 family)